MKTTKYPHLTQRERRILYNKQFRQRKKLDPKYQEKLRAYRREHLKKDYKKMRETQPEKFKIEMQKHSRYASKSRKRAIANGDGEKYKRGNRKYYRKNKTKMLSQSKANRKWIKENNPKQYMLSNARTRAKRKKLTFTITIHDFDMPIICPVFGIPLKLNNSTPQYDSPSLDRIDNDRGYVPGNVHVVSYRANSLKRDATVEELKMLAQYFCKN